MEQFVYILSSVVNLLIAVIFHEIAHGYAAQLLGDSTAKDQGRLTVNPLPHIDPVMTVFVPLALIMSGSPVVFGGAKPVPVNPSYFTKPLRGMALVAIAGPLSNAMLFLLFWLTYLTSTLFGVSGVSTDSYTLFVVQQFLVAGMLINVVLGIFNLVPIPPLDGSRIVAAFLPKKLLSYWFGIERFGILIVFLALYSGFIGTLLESVISVVISIVLH